MSCRLDRNVCFKVYTEGSYFGDIEVLNQSRRLFSVRAEGPLVLCVLDRNTLDQAFRWSPACSRIFEQKTLKRYISFKVSLRAIKLYRKMTENNDFWTADENHAEDYINNKLTSWLNLMGNKTKLPRNSSKRIQSSRTIKSFALKSHLSPRAANSRNPKVPRVELFENQSTKRSVSHTFSIQALKELEEHGNAKPLISEISQVFQKLESKLELLSETLTAATRDHLSIKETLNNRFGKPPKDYSIKIDAANSFSAILQENKATSLRDIRVREQPDLKPHFPPIKNLLMEPLQLNEDTIKSDSAIISPVMSPTSRQFDRAQAEKDNDLHSSMGIENPCFTRPSSQRKLTRRLSGSKIHVEYRVINFETEELNLQKGPKPRQPPDCVAEEWSKDSGIQLPQDQTPKIDLGRCLQQRQSGTQPKKPPPPGFRALQANPRRTRDPPGNNLASGGNRFFDSQMAYSRDKNLEGRPWTTESLRKEPEAQVSASKQNIKIIQLKPDSKPAT